MTSVCLTVDICENSYDSRMRWNYLVNLRELRQAFVDGVGKDVCFTWFVRGDYSIGREFGSVTALFERQEWKEFQDQGDEIGWHAHFYSESSGREVQNTKEERILIETKESLDKVQAIFPSLRSARIGRFFSSSNLLSQMYQSGIQVDASCLPDRSSNRADLVFDWEGSPQQPFYPAAADYRKPGGGIGILEVPFSVVPVKLKYDAHAVNRYLNLAYHSELLSMAMEHILALEQIVMILHPFELDNRNSGKHPAFHFSLPFAVSNLRSMVNRLRLHHQGVTYVRIADFADMPGW